MFPKMLIKDPAGKEGWPEGAAEPRMLDGDVHFVSKQHGAAQIQPGACPAYLLIYTTGSFWNNDVNCLLLTPPARSVPPTFLC